jgi:hypothetical protein
VPIIKGKNFKSRSEKAKLSKKSEKKSQSLRVKDLVFKNIDSKKSYENPEDNERK